MKPLPHRSLFLRRSIRSLAIGCGLIGACLGVGVIGYHYFAGMIWIDSLVNASMILSGMGPVGELRTDAGKLFASFYALFSGVAFISSVGVVLGPAVHRFLHRFHLEMTAKQEKVAKAESRRGNS